VPATRGALRALLPFLMHAFAREVDAAVGLLLHSSLDLPDFVPQALRLLDVSAVLRHVALWTLGGAVSWALLAAERARREQRRFADALDLEARLFAPLWLRPVLTSLALLSLALEPTFPYAFTLPVALGQDWAAAQDVAVVAVLVAARAPAPRLPSPRTGEVFFIALLAYALLAPPWSRHWDGHPGNEPKYLRMAVAVGRGLTLDVSGVDRPMEELPVEPLPSAARRAARQFLRASRDLAGAVAEGTAVRAPREDHGIAHLTVRGRDGGAYHVLAPGPSMIMAPVLRVDRALNRRQGTPGRLAVTLLAWNALAAALVAAVFVLARDASGSPGLAAALAGLFALLPPFVFYSFQFYPEVPAALVLAVAMRMLALPCRFTTARLLVLGALVSSLPWLHQKYLPVWAVLVAMAVLLAIDRLVTLRALAALLLPQAVSSAAFLLYNFGVTGSARPDALFRALGREGVSPDHAVQGVLGLLLDARYGIVPYVPLLILALGGLALRGGPASRLRFVLPAAAVYYVTVAAAENWTGSISNLGRFVLPLCPLAAALVAAVLHRARGRGVATLALALAGWSALIAVALWRYPPAANDGALLLAKSVFADGHVYLPDLLLRSWAEAPPRLPAQLVVWTGLGVLVLLWLRRAAEGTAGRAATPALAGLAAACLVSALVLERWPSAYTRPRFQHAVALGPDATAFVLAGARAADGVLVSSGDLDLLVRSRSTLEGLPLEVHGEGRLELRGRPPLVLPRAGVRLDAPLEPLAEIRGRRGLVEFLYRLRVRASRPFQARLGR
jgi:hypothetical protein